MSISVPQNRLPSSSGRLTTSCTRRRASWFSFTTAAAVLLSAGCAAEAPLPTLGARPPEHGDGGVQVPESSDTVNADVNPISTEKAPGIKNSHYPEAPYGTRRGATMADLAFVGWRNPSAAAHDAAATETIRLSDFYNPDGANGIEYILLNAVTVWCSVCRLEYEELEDKGTYASYSTRGLEIIGVLFEDNNGDPPTYRDLSNWSERYNVAFPFVTDPGFKTGVYFDRDATPMNMIIDARTMEIVRTMTGYDPAIYEQIDRLLTARGR